jgi:hypothetical protein
MLCLTTALLWMASYFWYASLTKGPAFGRAGTDRQYTVYFHAGIIGLTTWRVDWNKPPPPSRDLWRITAWHARRVWRDIKDEFLMGLTKFQYRGGESRIKVGALRERHLRISYAFPTAVFAVAPLVWLRRVVRVRHRRTAGQCQRCGYDLRASPDRCPECGAITPETHSAVHPLTNPSISL